MLLTPFLSLNIKIAWVYWSYNALDPFLLLTPFFCITDFVINKSERRRGCAYVQDTPRPGKKDRQGYEDSR